MKVAEPQSNSFSIYQAEPASVNRREENVAAGTFAGQKIFSEQEPEESGRKEQDAEDHYMIWEREKRRMLKRAQRREQERRQDRDRALREARRRALDKRYVLKRQEIRELYARMADKRREYSRYLNEASLHPGKAKRPRSINVRAVKSYESSFLLDVRKEMGI